jgi:hypothetical protein
MAFVCTVGKENISLATAIKKKNNHSQFGRGNHPRARYLERGAPRRVFTT